jgi:transcriptional regulator with XRE-family HTH domain
MNNLKPRRRESNVVKRHKESPGAGQELRIGARLRHARMVNGFTLKEVAKKVGCSESLLSKFENDKANPSFATLHKLSASLGINVSALFSQSRNNEDIISHAGKRPVIVTDRLRKGTGIKLERLIPYSRDHLLQGNIHLVAPGGRSAGNIIHSGEEIGYILEGEIELIVSGRRFRAKMGDSFHFRSELPHGYRNIGKTPARILWVNTPPTF